VPDLSLRLVALWVVLAAAYAATLGLPRTAGADYAGDEPHHLIVAESIVSDGDLDVRDEYQHRAYGHWLPGTLQPAGEAVAGRWREPQGMGLAAVIAPFYALGGPRAAAGALGALAALAFVLAALLARRMVPEPWASAGAFAVGLSPPVLGNATAILPGLLAGGLLALAMLCALSQRDRPRRASAVTGALALAALPWLDPWLLVPAAPVAVALVHWSARGGRRMGGLLPAEIMLASLVFCATLDDGLYGGVTPRAAAAPGPSPAVLDRLGRIAGLWLDRDAGLLRWAPVLALVGVTAWAVWRSRRERLGRALPARREAELAALLALSVCAGQLLVAVIATPGIDPPGFPGASWAPALPAAGALCGWGLRRAPGVGAVLVALTLAASAWLLIALRTGAAASWDRPPRAPWGPLTDVFPHAGTSAATLVGVAALAVLAVLAIRADQGAV
jgi:hypothetical protein